MECQFEKRVEERVIKVIDTPGVMDTSAVEAMGSGKRFFLALLKKDQARILTELARMFLLAPYGFDAISIVMKYGSRFSLEDGQALQLLQSFLGEEAKTHMFLILSNADQAKREAENKKISLDECVRKWIESHPPWVKDFIEQIGQSNVVYFDNILKEDEKPDEIKKQLSHFIQVPCRFNFALICSLSLF